MVYAASGGARLGRPGAGGDQRLGTVVGSAPIERVAALDGDRFVWPHLLDEVGRALPDYTWITTIESLSPLPNLSMRVRGMAANPVAITAFIRNLSESLYIGDVQLEGSQQVQMERFVVQSFELALTYAQPPDSVVRTVPIVQR